MKPHVVEERTHWALRVRVLDHEGVWGEPFYWPPYVRPGLSRYEPTDYGSRERARSGAKHLRGEWRKAMGCRRVTATPVQVAVRTTIREVG